MAPTTVLQDFKQRKLRSSSVTTPKKKSIVEENIAPNSEIKCQRKARQPRVAVEKLRGVSPGPKISPKKKQLLASPGLSSPLKSIQLNRTAGDNWSVTPKKSSAKTKLFAENLKENTSPKKRENTSPKKEQKAEVCFRKNISRFAEAKQCLRQVHPEQVVGREKQTKILREFLEKNLTNKKQCKTPRKNNYKSQQRSIYVSGPPGTGKTTCLKNLLDELPIEDNNVRVLPIVNCMTLGTSGGIFGKVVDALCPRKSYSSATEAQKILEKEVVTSKQTILLVLDEIDQLDSKSQEVLYCLFELPYLYNSKLVLVGIANALDLTDRILPRLSINEGYKPKELSFPAYSEAEILAILRSRLSAFLENTDKPLFHSPCLLFLAKKISAYSGDIRKALDVCQRALVLAELEDIPLININLIFKILNEIQGSSVTAAIRNGSDNDLPLQQKLLVASLLLMSNHRKTKDNTLGKLHVTYVKVCKKRGLPQVDLSEAFSLCSLLDTRGILTIHKGGWGSSTKDKKLSLRIDEGEIESALKDKTLLSGILKDVDCIAK